MSEILRDEKGNKIIFTVSDVTVKERSISLRAAAPNTKRVLKLKKMIIKF